MQRCKPRTTRSPRPNNTGHLDSLAWTIQLSLPPASQQRQRANVLTAASPLGSGAVIAVGWAASGSDRWPVAMARTSSGGGWQPERVPAPARADTILNAITVLGGDAWAVGSSDPEGATPAQTFVRYRDARGAWRTVASPNPAGANVLNAVAASSPSMCEEICYNVVNVAGTTVTSGGGRHPLVMTMSYPVGTAPPPRPPGGCCSRTHRCCPRRPAGTRPAPTSSCSP